MKLSQIGQAALDSVEVDDGAYSAALVALRKAAPQHDALILALESAASAYALDAMEAGFITGVSLATNPAGWLVE